MSNRRNVISVQLLFAILLYHIMICNQTVYSRMVNDNNTDRETAPIGQIINKNIADPVSGQDREKADFHIAGLIAACENFHSGELRIEESRETKSRGENKSVYMCFDMDQPAFRFDKEVFGELEQYARNSDLSAFRRGDTVLLYDADKEKLGEQPFHVLSTVIPLMHSYSASYLKFDSVKQFSDIYNRATVTSVTEVSSSVIKIIFEYPIDSRHPSPCVEHEIDIDSKLDFSLVRSSYCIVHRAGDNTSKQEMEAIEIDWKKNNLCPEVKWIPVRWTLNKPGYYHERKYEWIKLNEAIDPIVFTYEGMHLPDKTNVVDRRDGLNLDIGVTLNGKLKNNDTNDRIGLGLMDETTGDRGARSYLYIRFLLVLVGIGIIITAIIMRVRERRNTDDTTESRL